MTIELLPFQVRASQQIVNRFGKLQADPKRPMEHRGWETPFYQALAALTGAGKTPILADSVSQIRALLSSQPLVLWISKARAVVDQTFTNFEPGGKYHHLIDGFTVGYLSDLTPEVISDETTPFIAIATVGSFNQKEKADGTLTVHKVGEDGGDESLWTALTARQSSSGVRRPLIIVYDEGHNLSDQQTDLLLELEPDAILVASATMKTPAKLGKLIERMTDHGWSDKALADTKTETHACLVTAVSSKAVVGAGLVKRQIVLGGYTSIMETMVDDLIDAMATTAEKAATHGAPFEPKAIYVCKTNINQDDGSFDLPSKPFEQRKAPPILIWRYLVEQKKIDPADIAVYCDLKFERSDFPPPAEFNLFSGGDQDFGTFSAGNFTHIIFNQSLQEGWDDPACSFAYIDKSMGSQVQVEQVIGRVLRQPGAKHYPDPDLNTATFFIRVDNKQEFPRILKVVQDKIAAEMPEVHIEGYSDPKDRQRAKCSPKKVMTVPEIHIDASPAVDPLFETVDDLMDFRPDTINTAGKGEIQRVVQEIGVAAKGGVETIELAHSNRVTARWIMRREILALYPEVAKAIDWANGKFNAMVEITSPAAPILRTAAETLVDIYLENSDLTFEAGNPYTASDILVNPAKAKTYVNALHDRYDLGPFEEPFAEAIDATGLDWCRNPVNGGFRIPLLDKGETRNFFPDFLVWKDDLIFAMDPKGGHLIHKDAGRKLLNIQDDKGHRKILVRLFSEGKWTDEIKQVGSKGFTVWSMAKTGKIKAKYAATAKEAVEAALKP